MIKFFNTLHRKKEIFKPIKGDLIKIYTCGPTLYDYSHIGNLSTYLFADLLKRYLRYSGYEIMDVMNLTDVDDKTIKASQKTGKSLKKHTSFFANILLDDFKKLNIIKPKILCRATDHIKEMIDLIQILITKGFAYKAEDQSVYYKVSAFKNYGKFAGIKKEQLKVGASRRLSIDEYGKTEASDFVLWKAWSKKDGKVFWPSPFGNGRPGWHIECSAMSMKYLGESFDIHTGAIDLIFPHHQNEIAQSEAITRKQFVRFWLHRGFLKVNNEKMSKSLGNIFSLKDILTKVSDPMAFRYLILTNHYRKSLNFTFDSLKGSLKALNRIRDFVSRLSEISNSTNDSKQNLRIVKAIIRKALCNFRKYMDNNLNTPIAIADFFNFINEINKLIDDNKVGIKGADLVINFIKDVDQVWGFLESNDRKTEKKLRRKINDLIRKRDEYRNKKDWEKADRIREKLIEMNIVTKDHKNFTSWEFKK